MSNEYQGQQHYGQQSQYPPPHGYGHPTYPDHAGSAAHDSIIGGFRNMGLQQGGPPPLDPRQYNPTSLPAPGGGPHGTAYQPHHLYPPPNYPPPGWKGTPAPPNQPPNEYLPPTGAPPGWAGPVPIPSASGQPYPPPQGAPPPMAQGANTAPTAAPGLPVAKTDADVGQQVWYYGALIFNPTWSGDVQVRGYNAQKQRLELDRAIANRFDDGMTQILAPRTALQMEALAQEYKNAKKPLVNLLEEATASWYGAGLVGVASGPLGYDISLVKMAMKGLGTNEMLLNEVLLGRSPSDLELLVTSYHKAFVKDLRTEVHKEVSGNHKIIFELALPSYKAPASAPLGNNNGSTILPPPTNTQAPIAVNISQALVHEDVNILAQKPTNKVEYFRILTSRPPEHIYAVSLSFAGRTGKSLVKSIEKDFSGDVRTSLLYIVDGAEPHTDQTGRAWPGVMRDARLLEAAMAGFGTKDQQLVWRVVRAHWDKPRLEQIKVAFLKFKGKSLEKRVKEETSGSYQKLMLALLA